jgi:hypothetical protein
MILAHNHNAAMKRLGLGPARVSRRMKALGFHLINLPGRVMRHARRVMVRVSATAAADRGSWLSRVLDLFLR